MNYLQLNKVFPASGYWDQKIIEELFDYPNVVVVPGAYQADIVDDISMELANYPYCVVIISSDEEGKFPWQQLYHPRMKVYRQYSPADRQIPIGCPEPPIKSKKIIEYFYAGQANTKDRQACIEAIHKLKGIVYESEGFAQGLIRYKYNQMMGHAKIVPCPGGHVSPDSFRLYEALEAGCTPVVNNREYFTKLLGDFPFPCVSSWEELKYVEYQDYSAWWAERKRIMVENLKEDLKWLKQQS